jgi:hypothetical protein
MSAGSRWRRPVAALAACAALAGLAACSPGARPHPADRDAGVLPAGAAAALGRGTLYLLLGSDPISANLWRVDLPGGRTRQLTFNRPQYGVSNFDASPAGLVLGDASSGVDVAEVMRGGKPRLLKGGGGGVGDSPQINDAGQITDFAGAEQGVTRGPWSHDRLLLWASPAAAGYRTIYQTRPGNLASIGWNPAGTEVLAVNGPDNSAYTRLFTVSTSGQVRALVTLPGNVGTAWGRYGLAVSYGAPGNPAEVLGPTGHVLARMPAGWSPGCWNPSGSKLLVISRSQRRVGIWRPAEPGRVQDLGALPGQAIYQCSWTGRPAAGT